MKTGTGLAIALLLSVLPVFPQTTIVLKSADHDGKDDVWQKRSELGNTVYRIKGDSRNGTVYSGEMWFDSFPGPSGKYQVQFGVVLEPDGDPEYKVSAGNSTLGSGKYPYPNGELDCDDGSLKASTIDLGEHQIENGEKITVWGKSVYHCKDGSWHGAYTRWTDVKFILVSEEQDDTPPSTPKNLNVTAVSPTALNLTWSASTDEQSGIKNYVVYVDGKKSGSPSNESFTLSGLEPGQTYEIRVSALNTVDLESGKSQKKSGTTLLNAEDLVTVMYPNGGETFTVGNKIDIQWQAEPIVSEIVISVSPDNGNNWIPIIDSSLARDPGENNIQKFRWEIPAKIIDGFGEEFDLSGNTQVIISVSDYNEREIFDLSDNAFSIQTSSSILMPGGSRYLNPTQWKGQMMIPDGKKSRKVDGAKASDF